MLHYLISFIAGYILGFVILWITELRRTKKLGVLMVDTTDPEAKRCYITFSKTELRELPKNGIVKLEVREFNRQDYKPSNEL